MRRKWPCEKQGKSLTSSENSMCEGSKEKRAYVACLSNWKKTKLITFTGLTLVSDFRISIAVSWMSTMSMIAYLQFFFLSISFFFSTCYTGQLTMDSSCCMVIWYTMNQVFSLGSPIASLELFIKRVIFISRRWIGSFTPKPEGKKK